MSVGWEGRSRMGELRRGEVDGEDSLSDSDVTMIPVVIASKKRQV